MSTNNTNNTKNTRNTMKNPYGHLLDKYLDRDPADWEAKQQREKEAESRYGHLFNYAKIDNSILELMAKMEDDRIERQKQTEEEKKMAELRHRERAEAERRREDEHNARVRDFGESLIKRKQERMKAAEMEKKKKEEQQRIYGRIDGLMKIGTEAAEAYIKAMKEAGRFKRL